jgi:hypothetical protein
MTLEFAAEFEVVIFPNVIDVIADAVSNLLAFIERIVRTAE